MNLYNAYNSYLNISVYKFSFMSDSWKIFTLNFLKDKGKVCLRIVKLQSRSSFQIILKSKIKLPRAPEPLFSKTMRGCQKNSCLRRLRICLIKHSIKLIIIQFECSTRRTTLSVGCPERSPHHRMSCALSLESRNNEYFIVTTTTAESILSLFVLLNRSFRRYCWTETII